MMVTAIESKLEKKFQMAHTKSTSRINLKVNESHGS